MSNPTILDDLHATALALLDEQDALDRADEHTALIMGRLEAAERERDALAAAIQRVRGCVKYELWETRMGTAPIQHDDGYFLKTADIEAALASPVMAEAAIADIGGQVEEPGRTCDTCTHQYPYCDGDGCLLHGLLCADIGNTCGEWALDRAAKKGK
jgi:hypothetical protein